MLVRSIDDLSTSQAARELGLSVARVDQMLNQGLLPYTSTALGRLIDREAVMDLKRLRESKSIRDKERRKNVTSD